jgi:hypothetical protein
MTQSRPPARLLDDCGYADTCDHGLSTVPILLLLVAVVLGPAGLARAQPESPQFEAHARQADEDIEIDGALTEPAWSKAQPIDRLTQYEPNEGSPFSQPTEIRILYDDKRIYFGFTCFDSEMNRVIANEMKRDGQLHDNDSVYVLLDTYNDRRSAFFFRVNPLGAKEDAAIADNGDTRNEDWDAVWEARARMEEDRWTVELAIPFSQLRFRQADVITWGLNVGRSLKRDNEEGIWYPRTKADGFRARYKTTTLGELTGMEGIAPGRNFEMLPYVLPGATKAEGETTTGKFEVGFDAKFGITSNLIADMTINTDFAQVEADDEQVNLTRFSLFFPEKRPFFLEGASQYDFGVPRTSFRRPPPALLFYSRRIGLFEGQPVPILAGGKVTGKLGPYSVGILSALTEEATVLPDEDDEEGETLYVPRRNYTVLRVKRDVLQQSSVGVIAVNQDDREGYNRAGGVDFVYRPSNNARIRGMWARTLDEEDGDGDAAYIGGSWRNELFELRSSTMRIGNNFNPEVGFVQREGVQRHGFEARYMPWPQRFGIQEVFTGPEASFVYDLDGELLTRELSYFAFIRPQIGGSFRVGVENTFEYLDEEFEIRDGIMIPAGDYTSNGFSGGIGTEDGRAVGIDLRANVGEFFDGNRTSIGTGVSLRPSIHLGVETRYSLNHVDLPAGSFDANILSSRVDYTLTTDLFAKLFAQWNSDSEIVAVNFLLNFIYRPGSDFFLAFNQTYDYSGVTTELVDSAVVAKMTYWWNP